MRLSDTPWPARAAGFCLLALTTGCASIDADRSAEPAAPSAPIGEEELARAMRLAEPGPEHAELMALAGPWTTTMALAMAPGAEPAVATGTVTARAILGGRFLEFDTRGSMFGQPTESLTVIGFDRRRERYTLIGFDTLGTYGVSAEGVREADGVIRMHGRDPDPMGEQVYTFELELDPPDAYRMRVLFTSLGDTVYEPPYEVVSIDASRPFDD